MPIAVVLFGVIGQLVWKTWGTVEWGHQETFVSLEETPLPAWLSVHVLASQSLQAGFLRRAPAPVPHI